MGANPYDAVVVGGGHNGLVCACYLARAGLKVRLLERRAIVGGAAVTEEFHPGFRNSVASYTVSLLNPKIISDLRLREHGLEIVERPLTNFLPLPNGDSLKLTGELEPTQGEIARFSQRDADRLPAWYQMLETVADVLRDLLLQPPPNVGGGMTDILSAVLTGKRLKKLTMEGRRDLLALFTRSAGEMLDHWFSTEPIKALFGFDAVVGSFTSPYAPSSAYVLLHHVMGEVNGKKATWGHARGGMGAITQAMAKEAKSLGVEISTDCPVVEVIVRKGRASGAKLADGSAVEADRVIGNVNPKLLYGQLIAPNVLPAEFLERLGQYKCVSGTFRMNVALSELPDFICHPGKSAQDHHRSGIIIGPSLAYMDRAYLDARAQGWSSHPIVEMLIPSTLDNSLAPSGAHVASLFCQHFNPVLPGDITWDEVKETVADSIIDTLTRYAPNFKDSILGRMVLSPRDLEREFGLIGGDIFHGALSLDQLYSARPLLGYGRYRGPIPGLYMCGSGTHPGGGVSGAPGHNAAKEIIRDVRWRRHRKS